MQRPEIKHSCQDLLQIETQEKPRLPWVIITKAGFSARNVLFSRVGGFLLEPVS